MQETDFSWFKDNLDDLYKQYGSKFIVIKDKTVLGAYESYASAVRETEKTEPLGSFIVQQCGPDESAYTVYIASVFACN